MHRRPYPTCISYYRPGYPHNKFHKKIVKHVDEGLPGMDSEDPNAMLILLTKPPIKIKG
jgi:hypothetical protein